MICTSRQDTSELWMRFKQSGDPAARAALIECYAWIARVGADRVHVPPTPMFSQDDLYGHAAIGLIDAIEKFDPGKGSPFESYALQRVQGAVRDALRGMDWLPRGMRQKETRLREAMTRAEVTKGRSATDEELCAELGVTEKELEDIYAASNASALQSLDELVSEMGDLQSAASVTNNTFADPASAAEDSQVKRLLQEAIAGLAESERTVVALYYFENLTLKEIGKVLGVTESRACQLHTRAMLKLQTKLSCWLDVLYLAA